MDCLLSNEKDHFSKERYAHSYVFTAASDSPKIKTAICSIVNLHKLLSVLHLPANKHKKAVFQGFLPKCTHFLCLLHFSTKWHKIKRATNAAVQH